MKTKLRLCLALVGLGLSVAHAAETGSGAPLREILKNGGFEETAPFEKTVEKWAFPGKALPVGWSPEYTYGNAEAEPVPAAPGSPNRGLRLKRGALFQELNVAPSAEERVLEISLDVSGKNASCLIRVNRRDCFSVNKLTEQPRRYRGAFIVKPGERITRFALWTWEGEIRIGNVSAKIADPVAAPVPLLKAVAFPENACAATVWVRPGAQGLSVTLSRRDAKHTTLSLNPFSLSLPVSEEAGEVTTVSKVLPDAGITVAGLKEGDLRRYVRPNLKLYQKERSKKHVADWERFPGARAYRFPLTVRRESAGLGCLVDNRYMGALDGAVTGLVFSCAQAGAVGDISFEEGTGDTRYLPLPLAAFQRPAEQQPAPRDPQEGREPFGGVPFIRREGAGLDMGVTARHREVYPSYTFRTAFDGLRESCLAAVPPEQYIRAWVLCALDPDPKKDPSLTVRLTRFIPGSRFSGRGRESLADTTVRLPHGGEPAPAGFTRVGTTTIGDAQVPLWLAEIFLQSGEIQDIVFDDKGPKIQGEPVHPNLDVELLGPLTPLAHPFTDARHLPLASPASGVRVFGVTLEKPPVEMEVRQTEPGNIFHNGEKPELPVALRARQDGDYTLRWTVRDAEERVVAAKAEVFSLKASAGETLVPVPLAQPVPGWYGIVFELEQAGRTLLRHTASFALLGSDTRQAGVADSPFGTWWYTYHYCPKDAALGAGPLSLKAGLRRNAGAGPDEATLAPWKVTAGTLGWPGHLLARNASDAEIKAFIDDKIARFPSCDNIMIFHENAQRGYQVAPELAGIKVLPEHEFSNADALFAQAMRLAKLVREHYPKLKIVIGNSLGCSELVAMLLRRGFPEKYGDYVGLEVVSRTGQPEKLWAGGQQAGWMMREAARLHGCRSWGVTSCVECNYRNDRIQGQQLQAEQYVRDALLLTAYRAPHISLAVLFDTGNNYNSSFWGGTGLCRRYPFLYPKKSYVAVATLTKALDRAVLTREVPTGSWSVYALECKRPDGKWVYPLWTGRGTAVLTLRFAKNSRYELTDLYGRSRTGSTFWNWKRLKLTAGTAAQYLVSDEPVSAVTCGARAYPEDQPPANLRVVAPMDAAADWRQVPGKDPLLEETTRTDLPYRTAGTFELRQVRDEEKGDCLEVELVAQTNLPALMSEYTVLRLKEPVTVEGEPTTLGLWVKGNSGWGEVYWEIEDAKGVRRLSCGTAEHGTSVFDYDGQLATVNFDGWNFLRMPITEKSPVPDLSTGSVNNLWQKSTNAAVAYPIKVTGVAVSLPPRALHLTEMRPIRQVIRLKDLSVYK